MANLKEQASSQGGLRFTWGATHRDKDGNLISRQATVEPPAPPQCIRPSCLWKFVIDNIRFTLVLSYHARRVAYAEANRHKVILERYRTGEPAPQTMWQAIHANMKLRCPVCRKYNKDPLLFRRDDNEESVGQRPGEKD